jgi:hypothetical protein
MTPEIASRLLSLWERALPAQPIQRTAAILQMFDRDCAASDIAALTLGERHRALLRVRRLLFGSQFVAAIVCPACGEKLTAQFSAEDLASHVHTSKPTITWMCDDTELTLRAPTLGDLLHAADAQDVDMAWQRVVRRCIATAVRHHEPVDIDSLPVTMLEEAGAQLEHIDPDARHTLHVDCAACGEATDHTLELGVFLWQEIQTQALRLLRDVAQLARGYGWRESDILAMTPLRRAAYLEMLPG